MDYAYMNELASAAYSAYCQSCGGVSVRGDKLPTWDEQNSEIKQHWVAAVLAVWMKQRLDDWCIAEGARNSGAPA